MPDFVRLIGAPRRRSDTAIEHIIRVADIILITYDGARDATTITLRDVGQLPVEQGPDEIEAMLTDPVVVPTQPTS